MISLTVYNEIATHKLSLSVDYSENLSFFTDFDQESARNEVVEVDQKGGVLVEESDHLSDDCRGADPEMNMIKVFHYLCVSS